MSFSNRLPVATGEAVWHDSEAPTVIRALSDRCCLTDSFPARVGLFVDLVLIALLSVGVWFALVFAGVLTLGLLLPLLRSVWRWSRSPITRSRSAPALPRPSHAVVRVEVRNWTGNRPDLLQAFLMTALFSRPSR